MYPSNSKLKSAAQRWQASGLAKHAPIRDRLAMLSELIRRNDLTATEIRMLYYLLIDRTNAETGLCAVSDQNIADALSLNIRTVERGKEALKAKGIVDWSTQRFGKRNSVSLYRFNTRFLRSTDRENPDNQTGIETSKPGPQTGTKTDSQTGTFPGHFYAKFGSAELEAWDRHQRLTTGKSLPRDRAGGWYVATQWPPTKQPSLKEIFDL